MLSVVNWRDCDTWVMDHSRWLKMSQTDRLCSRQLLSRISFSAYPACIRRCRWGDTVRILPQWLFPIKLQWLAVVAFFPFVENIWKLFLLPWTEYTNVTDRRSVGQIPRDGSGYTKHIASRGKECARCFVYWLRFVGLSAECNCVLLFVFMKCSLT